MGEIRDKVLSIRDAVDVKINDCRAVEIFLPTTGCLKTSIEKIEKMEKNEKTLKTTLNEYIYMSISLGHPIELRSLREFCRIL